jgi:hypothetical protein
MTERLLAILNFFRTISLFVATGVGVGNCAKASRGELRVGILATMTGGGKIVGWLVSKTIRSGHLCADVIRMTDG